jgi:RNA polymerase subunit RPABC4/transcription elongation factor Spt4
MDNYLSNLQLADELYKKNDYAACIRECGIVIESGKRALLKAILPTLENYEERERIGEVERRVGRGKTYNFFHLTQLEGLYREANIFDVLKRRVRSNLVRTKRIDWKTLVQWRNDSSHGAQYFTQDDAMQMLIWTRTFLYESELVSFEADALHCTQQTAVVVRVCSGCDESVQDGWIYCPFCGIRLSLTCRSCKRNLNPDFRICPYCETKVPLCSDHLIEVDEKARQEYAILCRGAWLDGVINAKERVLLDAIRLELGLPEDEAEKIEIQEAPPGVMEYAGLVEGTLADGYISEAERQYLERKAIELGVDLEVARELEQALIASRRHLVEM